LFLTRAPNRSQAAFLHIRSNRHFFEPAFILLLVAAVCCSSGCRWVPLPKRVTTGIGLKLSYIPHGSFSMGANPGEPGAKPAEKPHKVTISKGF
jgi:formylglycine-generating enzyme required for sulfatase activity